MNPQEHIKQIRSMLREQGRQAHQPQNRHDWQVLRSRWARMTVEWRVRILQWAGLSPEVHDLAAYDKSEIRQIARLIAEIHRFVEEDREVKYQATRVMKRVFQED